MVRKQSECPVFLMNALISNFFILSKVVMLKLPVRDEAHRCQTAGLVTMTTATITRLVASRYAKP